MEKASDDMNRSESIELHYDIGEFLFSSWVLSGTRDFNNGPKKGCPRCNLRDAKRIPWRSPVIGLALIRMKEREELPPLMQKLRHSEHFHWELEEVINQSLGTMIECGDAANTLKVVGVDEIQAEIYIERLEEKYGSSVQDAVQFGHKLRGTLHEMDREEQERQAGIEQKKREAAEAGTSE